MNEPNVKRPAPPVAAQKKPKAPPKSKRERFQTLLPKRMTRALKAVETVGNCGNRAGYEYTDAEAARIIEDLTSAVAALRVKFRAEAPKKAAWSL